MTRIEAVQALVSAQVAVQTSHKKLKLAIDLADQDNAPVLALKSMVACRVLLEEITDDLSCTRNLLST